MIARAFGNVSIGFALVGLLGGCASPLLIQRTRASDSVRRVNFTETPELKDWAERAKRLGDEVYPKLLAMLTNQDSKPAENVDIVFKKRLPRDNRGVAIGRTVYINCSYFERGSNAVWSYTAQPENFEKLLIHELAHVAENRRFRRYSRKSPGYWSEGIADYARYKLGYTNGWSCPACAEDFPHFRSGYSCAGAFLLHVDAAFGSNVIRELTEQLRRGSYSDGFFAKATGRSLDHLWTEFQKTAYYSPVAAEVFRLHEALGYVNGIPPRNVLARANAYLKKKPGGVLTLESGKFLSELARQGKLPGLTDAKRNHSTFSMGLDPADFLDSSESKEFPAVRKWFGASAGEPGKYYYLVARSSKDAAWELQRAWRIGKDGHVLEEYPTK